MLYILCKLTMSDINHHIKKQKIIKRYADLRIEICDNIKEMFDHLNVLQLRYIGLIIPKLMDITNVTKINSYLFLFYQPFFFCKGLISIFFLSSFHSLLLFKSYFFISFISRTIYVTTCKTIFSIFF